MNPNEWLLEQQNALLQVEDTRKRPKPELNDYFFNRYQRMPNMLYTENELF
jgi:hypothetical protein